MISCHDWWPWTKPGYITMTWRQSSNQWSGGIAAHRAPKKFRVQKSAGIVLASLFGIKTASSSLIIFQRAKLSTQSISASAIEGHFERKTPREGHQGGLVLVRQYPSSPGTCNQEETGVPGLPVSWSPTLFSGSGPIWLPPVPWTEKIIERSPFSSDSEVIAAMETWLDGQLSEFLLSGLQKLEQRGKKCIELCGECVE